MKNKGETTKIFVLGFGILAVSTASIFIRFAQADAPSFVIAAGRLLLATLILAPFAIKRTIQELKIANRRTFVFLGLAGLFLGLHFASWITSLEFTTVASSVVLVTTAPLWVALLSPLFLKEKITRVILIGLVISLSGSILVGVNGLCNVTQGAIQCINMSVMFEGKTFWGNLLALAGAFLSAGYLMVGRRVRNSFSLVTYTFIVYGVAAVVLLLLVLVTDQKLGGYTTNTYLFILALAIVPQLLGHSSFNWALKYLSAAFVSIALLGEPVGTVILAYFFLSEKPALLELVGGVLILIGIAVASRTRKKEEITLNE
jgi:drug/metabolite transporter (DMT)-like permease